MVQLKKENNALKNETNNLRNQLEQSFKIDIKSNRRSTAFDVYSTNKENIDEREGELKERVSREEELKEEG